MTVCEGHAGSSESPCRTCGFPVAVRIHWVCTVCMYRDGRSPAGAAIVHPAVVAFHQEYGVDIGYGINDFDRARAALALMRAHEQAVASTGPLRVVVTVRAGGDELRLTLDERMDVVAVGRPAEGRDPGTYKGAGTGRPVMTDGLLGRLTGATERALRGRLEELERERDRLEDRLEAERERRAAAVSDRQTAEERVNRLEDRIADLEGQLEHAGGDAERLRPRGSEPLRGGRRRTVLARLERFRAPDEGALTAMVADDVPLAVREAFAERTALVERAAPCLVVRDDAGLIEAALDPPLAPDPFVEWADSFRVDRDWFEPTGEHAVALVRSDRFAYGEYDGPERVAFEGFTSDVKGQHSKGGYSQARFERRRDAQIEAHLERCQAVLDAREPDRLIVVGERTLLGAFDDRAIVTAPVDATGEPEPALADAVADFWTTTLTRL